MKIITFPNKVMVWVQRVTTLQTWELNFCQFLRLIYISNLVVSSYMSKLLFEDIVSSYSFFFLLIICQVLKLQRRLVQVNQQKIDRNCTKLLTQKQLYVLLKYQLSIPTCLVRISASHLQLKNKSYTLGLLHYIYITLQPFRQMQAIGNTYNHIIFS